MVTYFNRKDLIEFGNYLLSKERKESTSELLKDEVTHANIENWMSLKNVMH